MSKVSIITPWLGGKHLIADYAWAVADAHQVIAIDNGSDPETAAALQAMVNNQQAVKPGGRGVYIRNETNAGFAGANNQGYRAATGDIIIFLNSDIAGPPDWLRRVIADVQDGGLYGPALQRQLVYGMWLPYLEGWCVAATRETWDSIYTEMLVRGTIGPWDADAYPRPYWEDNDLCLRAMQAGYSLNQTAWPLKHKGGQSAGALIKWGEVFETNRATFTERVAAVWHARQQAPKPKVFDCFTFYNELDMLEARLELLGDVVDTFVIVEATQTFTGQPKPCYFRDNPARFARWMDRIISVRVDDMPSTADPWARETHQRNAILRGLKNLGLKPSDVVLIGDVDEIPDPATLPREIEPNTVVALEQQFYYYSPRFRHRQPWNKARACRADLLFELTPQEVREVGWRIAVKKSLVNTIHSVPCGWHLSYFGDIAAIQTKIAAFSHQEYNTPEYTNADRLAACLATGADLFGRAGVDLEDIGDTADMPDVLRRLGAPVEA